MSGHQIPLETKCLSSQVFRHFGTITPHSRCLCPNLSPGQYLARWPASALGDPSTRCSGLDYQLVVKIALYIGEIYKVKASTQDGHNHYIVFISYLRIYRCCHFERFPICSAREVIIKYFLMREKAFQWNFLPLKPDFRCHLPRIPAWRSNSCELVESVKLVPTSKTWLVGLTTRYPFSLKNAFREHWNWVKLGKVLRRGAFFNLLNRLESSTLRSHESGKFWRPFAHGLPCCCHSMTFELGLSQVSASPTFFQVPKLKALTLKSCKGKCKVQYLTFRHLKPLVASWSPSKFSNLSDLCGPFSKTDGTKMVEKNNFKQQHCSIFQVLETSATSTRATMSCLSLLPTPPRSSAKGFGEYSPWLSDCIIPWWLRDDPNPRSLRIPKVVLS